MIRYLFVGVQYNNELEKEYLNFSKHGLSAASNEFQWNLCDGFIQSVGQNFDILTSLSVGCFPKHYKKAYLENVAWDYRGSSVTEIGSWNLPVIKQLTREYRCAEFLQKWIDKTSEDQHVVILYSLYLPYMKAIRRVKERNSSLRAVIIVPDLPGEYGILPHNPLKAKVAAAIGRKALKLVEAFDGYVVLTKQMAQPLNIGNKPYVVVEGISNEKQAGIPAAPDNSEKCYFLYAGSLAREFGIISLLNAFEMLEDDQVELWICGSGNTENEIKERASKNDRIRFLGFRTKKEVHEMQQKATALVNPRPNEGEYTKYSFPSKTMGYMASGKPVVMYKLDGIPQEYDEYLIYPEGNSAEGLKNALQKVLDMSSDERIDFGKRAQRFIVEQKNSTLQVKKILDMIKEAE